MNIPKITKVDFDRIKYPNLWLCPHRIWFQQCPSSKKL